jgi:hypothetical protein
MQHELVPKPGWFCAKLLEKPVKSGFSTKFKEAVPKAEVLEQPHILFFLILSRNFCFSIPRF